MNRGMFCVAVAVLSAGIGRAQPEKASDLQQIQGLWKATSAETGGKPIGADLVKDMYIAFAGNRMIPFGEGDLTDAVYVFELNAKAKPKQIELRQKVKGKTVSADGIYALAGDTLKLCWDQDGGKRPASFDTPRDGRVFSVVLKREKAKSD